ncbi:hypothetical protein [Arthrobacter sp. UYCu723]
MKKTFAVIAVTGALLAGCAAPAAKPACQEEDYSGPVACYWDAQTQGNGAGQSFTWTGSTVIYSNK